MVQSAQSTDSVWAWFGGPSFLGIEQKNDSLRNEPALEPGHPFREHLLPANHELPLTGNSLHEDWWFPMIFLLVAMVAWVRAFHQKGVRFLINAFVTTRGTHQSMLDENVMMKKASVFLNLLFSFSLSMFVYLVLWDGTARMAGWQGGFPGFLQILGILGAVYLLKLSVIRLVGWVFDIRQPSQDYAFNLFLWQKGVGVLLLPLVILMAYLPLKSYNF
ncbi:MAG: DUF4271 domain-containing protein, partial [Flavobacteriales bacterium]|nr:DUF4271 domain-containing protein [Flavobacteriales bacterium]